MPGCQQGHPGTHPMLSRGAALVSTSYGALGAAVGIAEGCLQALVRPPCTVRSGSRLAFESACTRTARIIERQCLLT